MNSLFFFPTINIIYKKPHRINKQNLNIKIYYKYLKQIKNNNKPFKTPTSLKISDFNPKKLQFLIKSPPNQQTIKKQLKTIYKKPI